MKKLILIIFISLIISPNRVQAFSMDSVYRDVMRSENNELLPAFVKNSDSSSLKFDKEIEKYEETTETANETEYMSFVNKKQLRDDKAIKDNQEWQETLLAIEKNQVTPIDLERLQTKVDAKDPKATEIYAFMLTKGIGVSKDFIKAFNTYKKAESLGIDTAKQNSTEIYKAMTPDQRSKIGE